MVHPCYQKQKNSMILKNIQKNTEAKLIKKWKASMEENMSLRAMREVVLAFRAAAHLNDESEKSYKYTISDPDGMSFAPIQLSVHF